MLLSIASVAANLFYIVYVLTILSDYYIEKYIHLSWSDVI